MAWLLGSRLLGQMGSSVGRRLEGHLVVVVDTAGRWGEGGRRELRMPMPIQMRCSAADAERERGRGEGEGQKEAKYAACVRQIDWRDQTGRSGARKQVRVRVACKAAGSGRKAGSKQEAGIRKLEGTPAVSFPIIIHRVPWQQQQQAATGAVGLGWGEVRSGTTGKAGQTRAGTNEASCIPPATSSCSLVCDIRTITTTYIGVFIFTTIRSTQWDNGGGEDGTHLFLSLHSLPLPFPSPPLRVPQ